tara:strand:+ start:13036 stop:14259 length:1224 start_codon:yes stop_codon:yes gene_type:complete
MATPKSPRFDREGALSRNYSTRVGRSDRRISRPYRRPITPLFTKFEGGDIVENAQADVITSAMWSNNDGEMKMGDAEIFTSSVQDAASGVYYKEFYRDNPQLTASAEPQFAIAYGHYHGSGSAPISQYASAGKTPTKSIYSQYANLLLSAGDEQFTIGNVNETSSIFINVNRQRFKERIDPGNWAITISSSNIHQGHSPNPGVGSNITLTDDSSANQASLGDFGALYKVVSGSIGITTDTGAIIPSSKQYGWFYPDMGVIMLSPRLLEQDIDETNYCWCPGQSGNIGNANTNATLNQVVGMFTSSNTLIPQGQISNSFAARSSERVFATHYFCRLKNAEYNFSNNPTFTSGSQGTFSHPSMYKDPKVYITTVGMYNDKNELLATAKLSKPLLKSFTREALIRIKLEF